MYRRILGTTEEMFNEKRHVGCLHQERHPPQQAVFSVVGTWMEESPPDGEESDMENGGTTPGSGLSGTERLWPQPGSPGLGEQHALPFDALPSGTEVQSESQLGRPG